MFERDPAWDVVHTYRRYAAKGKLPPIKCPDCNYEYVVKISGDYTEPEPVLFCLICRSTLTIGIAMLDQMKAAIKEVRE